MLGQLYKNNLSAAGSNSVSFIRKILRRKKEIWSTWTSWILLMVTIVVWNKYFITEKLVRMKSHSLVLIRMENTYEWNRSLGIQSFTFSLHKRLKQEEYWTIEVCKINSSLYTKWWKRWGAGIKMIRIGNFWWEYWNFQEWNLHEIHITRWRTHWNFIIKPHICTLALYLILKNNMFYSPNRNEKSLEH